MKLLEIFGGSWAGLLNGCQLAVALLGVQPRCRLGAGGFVFAAERGGKGGMGVRDYCAKGQCNWMDLDEQLSSPPKRPRIQSTSTSPSPETPKPHHPDLRTPVLVVRRSSSSLRNFTFASLTHIPSNGSRPASRAVSSGKRSHEFLLLDLSTSQGEMRSNDPRLYHMHQGRKRMQFCVTCSWQATKNGKPKGKRKRKPVRQAATV